MSLYEFNPDPTGSVLRFDPGAAGVMGPGATSPASEGTPDPHAAALYAMLDESLKEAAAMHDQQVAPRKAGFLDRFATGLASNPIQVPQGMRGGNGFLAHLLASGANTFATNRAQEIAADPGSLANRILRQRQQAQPLDPLSRAVKIGDLIKTTAEAQKAGHPVAPKAAEPMKVSPGEMLIDPATGRLVYQAPAAPTKPEKPESPVKLAPGEVLVDPRTGKVVATGPEPPKSKTPIGSEEYSLETARRTIAAVDGVLPKISGLTAGLGGAIMSRIPGTDAKDVQAQLKEVASNVAFKALAQMRSASKTGGALGAVSDKEGDLLQSVQGSIFQDQSPDNLKRGLRKIKGSAMRFANALAESRGEPQPYPNAPPWDYDGEKDIPKSPASKAASDLSRHGHNQRKASSIVDEEL